MRKRIIGGQVVAPATQATEPDDYLSGRKPWPNGSACYRKDRTGPHAGMLGRIVAQDGRQVVYRMERGSLRKVGTYPTHEQAWSAVTLLNKTRRDK